MTASNSDKFMASTADNLTATFYRRSINHVEINSANCSRFSFIDSIHSVLLTEFI